MTEKEIIRLATEYKKNKRQIEELEKANERIKKLLREEIEERGGESLSAGDYKIIESRVKRETVDSQALKSELPSVWRGFVKVTEVKRFLIR